MSIILEFRPWYIGSGRILVSRVMVLARSSEYQRKKWDHDFVGSFRRNVRVCDSASDTMILIGTRKDIAPNLR